MPEAATPPELSAEQADATIRRKQFIGLLVVVAIIGLVVSIAAWLFLEGTYHIQQELYVHLPHTVGYQNGPPKWWSLPVLAVGALLVALAITRLPGNGGHIPAKGLSAGGPSGPNVVPGVLLAGLATIGFGLVLGPEAPLIVLGAGLAGAMISLARRDMPQQSLTLITACGSFAAMSFLFASPLIAAVILIEAIAIGGARLRLLLVPGLLASGIGSLGSLGVGSLSGLSTHDYALECATAPRPPRGSTAKYQADRIERAVEQVSWPHRIPPAAPNTWPDQAALAQAIRELQAGLAAARPSCLVESVAFLVEQFELSIALLAESVGRHADGLAHVRNAIARLRSIQDESAILDAATVELCDACGFDRAMLTEIDGSEVIVRSVHIPADPQLEAWVLESSRTNPQRLDDLRLEADMIRRRVAILVADVALEQRTQPPFVTQLKAPAYVAAPIIRERRAIGFLHADVYASGGPPDDIDRDRLSVFAEGLGYAIEHTMLYQRLLEARDLTASLWQAIEGLTDGDIGIESVKDSGGQVSAAADRHGSLDASPENDITGQLTERERGVLELIAQGATNAVIGEKLVISPSTVKSHVANILRKLGASNRADAVARYLQATPGKT